MSLKAKLEAVIYAAEEPVTLAQLAALFAADALEWKAEQAAASAEQAAEADAAEPMSLLAGEFDALELEPVSADSAASEPPTLELDAEPVPEFIPESSPQPAAEADLETSTELEPAPAAETTADSELEARRLARQRDREVRAILRQLIDELIASYASDSRGVEIREIAGGYRMATKPECHDAVRSFVKSLKPALKLSLPALETLAVIAYKQPVTAPEVNEIRGVDSSAVFGSLLARKLIATAGRKQVIGRPILYKTTREFLLRFGLKDVAELPSMDEFEKMAAMELDEPEPASEGVPGRETSPSLNLELDESRDRELEDQPDEQKADQSETAVMAAGETEPTPAEAAPAAPSPTEQAEIENFPHDR
jgi:segregation and condensation protein B